AMTHVERHDAAPLVRTAPQAAISADYL
ncbi:winged helix family transcriptional regulator, partial [Burkholderia multivorans]